MADVLSFPGGRSFRLVIQGRHYNNPSVVWGTTFWVYSIAAGQLSDLVTCATRARHFLRLVSMPQFEIGDVLISTGAHDGNPYNPNTFTNVDFPWEAGQRIAAQGEPLAAEAVLWVTRAVAVGRQGKLFLRGVLSEGDVWANSGKWVLANATAMTTLLVNSLSTSAMQEYFVGGGNTILKFALITTLGDYVRALLGMSVRGVNLIKIGHRYFDRGPITEGPAGHTNLQAPEDVLADITAWQEGYGNSTWTPPDPDTSRDEP